jgi:hypothetical protein
MTLLHDEEAAPHMAGPRSCALLFVPAYDNCVNSIRKLSFSPFEVLKRHTGRNADGDSQTGSMHAHVAASKHLLPLCLSFPERPRVC